MGNGTVGSDSRIERLFRLRTKVDKLMLEGKRDIGELLDVYQEMLSHGQPFLKLMNEGKIDSANGTETLYNSDLFPVRDVSLTTYGTDLESCWVESTMIQMYRGQRSTEFYEIAQHFRVNFDALCLTQHQICNFVRKFGQWIGENGGGDNNPRTYALLRIPRGYFVVTISTFARFEFHAAVSLALTTKIDPKPFNLIVPQIPKRV